MNFYKLIDTANLKDGNHSIPLCDNNYTCNCSMKNGKLHGAYLIMDKNKNEIEKGTFYDGYKNGCFVYNYLANDMYSKKITLFSFNKILDKEFKVEHILFAKNGEKLEHLFFDENGKLYSGFIKTKINQDNINNFPQGVFNINDVLFKTYNYGVCCEVEIIKNDGKGGQVSLTLSAKPEKNSFNYTEASTANGASKTLINKDFVNKDKKASLHYRLNTFKIACRKLFYRFYE